jgi:hypothetical protein
MAEAGKIPCFGLVMQALLERQQNRSKGEDLQWKTSVYGLNNQYVPSCD